MKVLSLVFVLFFSHQVLAGYLIEPMLIQHTGTRKLETVPSLPAASAESSLSGGGFALRAAYMSQSWWLGLEMRNADASADVNGTPNEFATYDLGLNAGARFASGLRLYGSYLFEIKQAATSRVSEESSVTTTFFGSGFRVGVGYMFGNQITLNLDYTLQTFKKSTGENEIDDLSTVFSKYEHNPIHFSIGYAFGGKSK